MDCLEGMKMIPDASIDLVVTSPPYDNLRTYDNDIDKTWGEHIWRPILAELFRVTKQGGVVVWVVNDATINGSETGTSFRQALYAMGCGFNLHDTMIYQKKNPIPQNHNRYEQSFEYMFVFSKGVILFFRIRMTIEENGQQSKTVFLYFYIPSILPNQQKPLCQRLLPLVINARLNDRPTLFIQSIMDDGEGLCHQSLGVIILW